MDSQETRRLAALRSYSMRKARPHPTLDRLTALAGSLFGAPIALVSLIDEQKGQFISRIGVEAEELSREMLFCAHALDMGPNAVMVVEDLSQDFRFASNPLVAGPGGLRFYAGATLTTADGTNLGALCVLDREPRARPSDTDLERLQLLAGVVVDELELVRAHQQASRKQRLLEIAEELSEIGHWRLDLETGAVDWSDSIFRIHGLTRETFDPQVDDAVAYYHPDDRDQVRRHLQAAKETRKGFQFQLRLYRTDGALRLVTARAECELGPDGEPVALIGMIQDVTDHADALTAAKRSAARYRLLADNASDMIVRMSPRGDILFVSPGSAKVLGYAPEEMLRRDIKDFIHPDDHPDLARYYADLAAKGPGAAAPPLLARGRAKDGRWVWMEGQPTLFFDENGRVTGVQDTVRDISSRKALEAELQHARAQAEAAASVKAEFLSNMSHELRTPLTAVLGFSRLIEEQPELSSVTRDYAAKASNAGRALMSTINDILDFSKLEARQVEIVREACDPGELLGGTLALFSLQAQAKGVSLRAEGLDELPPGLMLAADRVRQVLFNLLGNAVKFTEAGTVGLQAAHQDGRLIVTVSDTGAGMPVERLGELFRRFSQIDGAATRRHGGTGLGLAICKGLIEAMDGDIGVDSVLGEGSRFWFSLPAPPAEAATVDDDAALLLVPPEGCRVLVVDDNTVNRELVAAVLDNFGVDLVQAEDGVAGVEAAAIRPFDVVLMDLHMPRMDGQTAARRIREAGGVNGAVPILAFSADTDPALPTGLFDGLLAKPLELKALIQGVAAAVRRERARAA